MTIQKIKSGRITSLVADEYVGEAGIIFYNQELGDLRLSDGVTFGGIPINTGSGGGGGATIVVSAIPPSTAVTGTLWWNSVTGELNIRYANGWRIASTTPGPTGPKGDTGDTGANGTNGSNGTSIVIKGSVLTSDLLPLTGEIGDLFVVTSTSEGFFWNGTAWQTVGLFQGPQGDTGDTGPQGIQGDIGPAGAKGDTGAQGIQGIKGDTGSQGLKGDTGDTGSQGLKGDTGDTGPKGDTGDTGAQGIQGIQGEIGLTGLQGEQGLKGDTGDTGTSIVITGSVLSVSDLPLSGTVGDFIVVTSTGDGYFWNSTNWQSLGQFRGPQGIQGDIGPAGADGRQGIDGAPGAKGDTGDTGPQGIQGDIGPAGVKGDTGDTGPQGIQGDIGPQGAKGDTGDTGVDALWNYLGAYNSGIIYTRGDIVTYLGQTWYRNVYTSAGYTPGGPENYWDLISAKGDIGPAGADGRQGIDGAPGVKGDTGDTGPQGDIGPAGPQGDLSQFMIDGGGPNSVYGGLVTFDFGGING